MQKIILASQSPQRKKLLEKLGISFTVVPANVDEKSINAPTSEERAQQIAFAKAQKIQSQNPDAIIIAGDTFVVVEGKELEKPSSLAEAEQMLSLLSGKTAKAISGLAYFDPQLNLRQSEFVVTTFTFRKLSQQEIADYVQHNPVLTWSAAFSSAYDEGVALVATVDGSLTSFTHGLSLEKVAKLLQKSGVDF